VSPGCRQRLLPNIRQRFSTACHSVSPWRPALRDWTTNHGDEMKTIRWRRSVVDSSRCLSSDGAVSTGSRQRLLPAISRRLLKAICSISHQCSNIRQVVEAWLRAKVSVWFSKNGKGHRQKQPHAPKHRWTMSDGVQRDVPGSKSSASDADRLDGGTSRLSRKMPASSSATTNRNNCTVVSIRSRLTSVRLTRQVFGSLRLCVETGDVVSASCVLSTSTLTSGGDDKCPLWS